MINQEDIAEINSVNWFHTIELAEGLFTKGSDNNTILSRINLPDDLSGKTVLDIATWDGFYAFECEKRGADRVLATDDFVWKLWNDGYTGDKGFNLAHRILKSKVEKLQVSIESLRDNPIEKFDIVIMLGVLYHAPDPLGYLRAAFQHTKEMFILETHVNLNDLPYPAIAYYPGTALMGDPTNYWGPNAAAVVGMLRDVGFKDVKVFDQVDDRQVFHAFR